MLGIGSLFLIFSFEFTATVRTNIVNIGEPFNIDVKISGEKISAEPIPPQISEFQISGKSTYTSSQITIINGKMEKSFTTTYVYTFIPKKTGEFEIPPFTLTYKGKTYYTNKINITVIGEETKKKEIKKKESIFIETYVSKKNIYEGEGIVVEYKLFTRKRISGLEFSKRPDFPDFWKEEIYIPKEVSFKKEIIDGIEYYTMTLYKVFLYPLKSGILRIPELGVYVSIAISDIFDFFGDTYEILSSEKEINVKSLPSPKPESFSGGVGNFKTRVYFEKDTVVSGEGTNLIFEVEGTGNLRFITPPEIKGDNEIKVYRPEEQIKITSKTDIEKGVKKFKYLVVPLTDGIKSLKSFKFSYFDPKKNSYIVDTIRIPYIMVIPGEVTQKEETKKVGKDIYFIKTDFSLRDYDFKYKYYYFFTIIFTLLPIFGVFYFIESTKRIKDLGYSRLKTLPKVTRKRLKEIRLAIKKKDRNKFYSELHKLLLDFVKHRYNIESYGLTMEELKEKMIEKNIDPKISNDFIDIINQCNMYRYSPTNFKLDITGKNGYEDMKDEITIYKKVQEIFDVLS